MELQGNIRASGSVMMFSRDRRRGLEHVLHRCPVHGQGNGRSGQHQAWSKKRKQSAKTGPSWHLAAPPKGPSLGGGEIGSGSRWRQSLCHWEGILLGAGTPGPWTTGLALVPWQDSPPSRGRTVAGWGAARSAARWGEIAPVLKLLVLGNHRVKRLLDGLPGTVPLGTPGSFVLVR